MVWRFRLSFCRGRRDAGFAAFLVLTETLSEPRCFVARATRQGPSGAGIICEIVPGPGALRRSVRCM